MRAVPVSASIARTPPPPAGALALLDTLLAALRTGRWAEGARLPTERALCAHHQIGRAAVRHALAELKQRGLVTQRVGSGTFVAPGATARLPPPTPAPAISPAELMQARLIVEPGLLDLVIQNATAADFDAIARCCAGADAATSLDEFEHWDSRFHEALAAATHNRFIAEIFTLIGHARDQGDWGLLKRTSATPQRRAAYQREHTAILAALRERDAAAARAAMVAHLLHVRHNMFGF